MYKSYKIEVCDENFGDPLVAEVTNEDEFIKLSREHASALGEVYFSFEELPAIIEGLQSLLKIKG